MFLSAARSCFPSVGLLLLLSAHTIFAQDAGSDKEDTWYSAMGSQRREVEPQNLELLSIQVSKLPRDNFGHGKLPGGGGFASSFVAASGTGIYGVFRLDPKAELKYQADLSSLEKFTDDRGKDITENPGTDDVNEFFDSNKKLSVKLSRDQSQALFTVRGYSTPTVGATSLIAEAKVTFLSLSQEKSATVKTKLFGTSDTIEVGPLAFRVAKNAGQIAFRTKGRARWKGDRKKEWAWLIDSRKKPVKQIEVLDEQGKVLWKTNGPTFDGKRYTEYMGELDAQPDAVRATWYEKWELITMPLKIETRLGI